MSQTIILVTGANSGIGYALVHQLLSNPSNHVLLGARSAEKGQAAVTALQSEKLSGKVTFLEIDVSSSSSVEAAAKVVEEKFGRVDIVVNNAGIGFTPAPLVDQFAAVVRTNAAGPWHIVETFAPLLRKSSGTPRVVNVSSGLGSMELVRRDELPRPFNKGTVAYSASKAALNMVTTFQAMEYGPEGFKVFSYCPGFVETNLSSYNTGEYGAKKVETSIGALVDIVDGKRDAEHGCFLNNLGGAGQYPW